MKHLEDATCVIRLRPGGSGGGRRTTGKKLANMSLSGATASVSQNSIFGGISRNIGSKICSLVVCQGKTTHAPLNETTNQMEDGDSRNAEARPTSAIVLKRNNYLTQPQVLIEDLEFHVRRPPLHLQTSTVGLQCYPPATTSPAKNLVLLEPSLGSELSNVLSQKCSACLQSLRLGGWKTTGCSNGRMRHSDNKKKMVARHPKRSIP